MQEGALSEDRQRAVTGHTLRGEGDATDLVDDIKQRRRRAAPPPAPPPQPGAQKPGGQEGPAGPEALSARTRELFALIPVALLVTAGFTAVLITNSDQLGNLSVFYGGLLPGALRRHPHHHPDPAPRRRSVPVPAGRAARRVRDGDALSARQGLARDQANWFVLGLVLFSATIIFLRDYEALERYRYLIALAGIVLLIMPRFLGHATNDAFLAVDLGPITFQPTELAKICIVVFLASYLNEHREVLVVGARKVAGSCCRRSSTSGLCWSSGARRWCCWSSSATWAAR